MQQFDRDLLLLLHDVARLLRTRFDQRARARGMTRAQWVILARVNASPGLSQNELASLLEVEPISVGRLIDRLESRGMVERRPDPTDRRIWRLHLLPGAEPVLEEISKARDVLGDELLQGVDPAVRTKMVDALLKMKNNLTAEAAPMAVGQ
ncbi:MAG TPA: MarR family transcriptional regulator [Rhizomicrobium sp.]|jgi:DNA-binding MarR family transcriptional regulator|nr:MarR family transcriptional regulator [Rhizomicrobium sp.]